MQNNRGMFSLMVKTSVRMHHTSKFVGLSLLAAPAADSRFTLTRTLEKKAVITQVIEFLLPVWQTQIALLVPVFCSRLTSEPQGALQAFG